MKKSDLPFRNVKIDFDVWLPPSSLRNLDNDIRAYLNQLVFKFVCIFVLTYSLYEDLIRR
jgi:hypothetical protein